MAEAVAQLAPALDVSIQVQFRDQLPIKAVEANDWKRIDPAKLILRTVGDNKIFEIDSQQLAPFVRPILDSAGRWVGRGCIAGSTAIRGIITVGGLIAQRAPKGFVGLLLGSTSVATRDQAQVLLPASDLARWATEQAQLREQYADDTSTVSKVNLRHVANTVLCFGGDTGKLPIAIYKRQWITAAELRDLAAGLDKISFVEHKEDNDEDTFSESVLLGDTTEENSTIPAVLETFDALERIIAQAWDLPFEKGSLRTDYLFDVYHEFHRP
jgi:hypothetical protein